MLSKAAALFCAFALSHGWAAGPSAEEIVRRMCEQDSENLAVRQQYTYKKRTVVNKLDKNGNTKNTEVKTEEVLWIDGTEYERLVAKNDRPLSPDEEKTEQEKFEREVAKRKGESESQRRKRLAKKEKELREEQAFRRQMPQAFRFTLLGEEVVSGRAVYRISAEPKPGVKLSGRAKSMFPKMRGVMWIDKKTFEMAKVEAETIENISFALGAVRLHKGTRVSVEQAHVNGEVWFPTRVRIAASGRAFISYGVRVDINQRLYDFRKYSVESTVTVAEER